MLDKNIVKIATQKIDWLCENFEDFADFLINPSFEMLYQFCDNSPLNEGDQFTVENGSFRMVIIFEDEPFVLKFDIREDCEDYTEFINGNYTEMKRYREIKEDKLACEAALDMVGFLYNDDTYVIVTEKATSPIDVLAEYCEEEKKNIYNKKLEENKVNKPNEHQIRMDRGCDGDCEDCWKQGCPLFPAHNVEFEIHDMGVDDFTTVFANHYGHENAIMVSMYMEDIHEDNVGIGPDGKIKLIDLGGYGYSY